MHATLEFMPTKASMVAQRCAQSNMHIRSRHLHLRSCDAASCCVSRTHGEHNLAVAAALEREDSKTLAAAQVAVLPL